jgi:hypothetical protein
MKILIVASNPELAAEVSRAAETAGHVVTDKLVGISLVVQSIIRDGPHLLFGLGHWPVDVVNDLARLFPDLSIRVVSRSEDWRSILGEQLALPVRQPSPRRYAEGTRLIYHDNELAAYNKGKLHRPGHEPGWEAECARQEGYFLLQLQTGLQNHAAAKRYYDCMMAQQEGLDQELTYRLCHGSYKGLCWTRDLAARWSAVLAHYVSGVELDCLPSPHPACPDADHVHHSLPVWGAYALGVVSAGRPRQSTAQNLIKIAAARFEGQPDDQLLAASLSLYGLAKALQLVAQTQVECMAAWLDSELCQEFPDLLPRSQHRASGIVREFWGLEYIVHTPSPLPAILRGFHAGTTHVAGNPALAPTFKAFLSRASEFNAP